MVAVAENASIASTISGCVSDETGVLLLCAARSSGLCEKCYSMPLLMRGKEAINRF